MQSKRLDRRNEGYRTLAILEGFTCASTMRTEFCKTIQFHWH